MSPIAPNLQATTETIVGPVLKLPKWKFNGNAKQGMKITMENSPPLWNQYLKEKYKRFVDRRAEELASLLFLGLEFFFFCY